jgi:Uma2 family endonuclease
MSTTTLPHEPLLQNMESVTLPETDGVPLGNIWHRLNINLLCESLGHHWRHRRDFFVGGNMCVFHSVEQARNRDFLGPDVFVTQGGDRDKPRDVWAIWQENNRGLDVAIELLSPSTAPITT